MDNVQYNTWSNSDYLEKHEMLANFRVFDLDDQPRLNIKNPKKLNGKIVFNPITNTIEIYDDNGFIVFSIKIETDEYMVPINVIINDRKLDGNINKDNFKELSDNNTHYNTGAEDFKKLI